MPNIWQGASEGRHQGHVTAPDRSYSCLHATQVCTLLWADVWLWVFESKHTARNPLRRDKVVTFDKTAVCVWLHRLRQHTDWQRAVCIVLQWFMDVSLDEDKPQTNMVSCGAKYSKLCQSHIVKQIQQNQLLSCVRVCLWVIEACV